MKEVILKFKLDGVENSLSNVIAIQKAIEKLKSDMASGISTEGFTKSQEALAALEAEYAKLTGVVEQSNNTINASNADMADSTESSTTNAGDAIEELGEKQKDLASDTKSSASKIKASVTEQASHTQKSFKSAGDNIEKFAKGIVDAVTGVALIMGSSEESANKLAQGFAKTVGIATAVKGTIEGVSAGFDILKSVFPGVITGLQAIWTTMLANPILAIIAGVVALGAAIYAFVSAADDGTEAIKRENEALEQNEQDLKDSQAANKAWTDEKLRSTKVIDDLIKQNYKNEIDLLEAKQNKSSADFKKLKELREDLFKTNIAALQEEFKQEKLLRGRQYYDQKELVKTGKQELRNLEKLINKEEDSEEKTKLMQDYVKQNQENIKAVALEETLKSQLQTVDEEYQKKGLEIHNSYNAEKVSGEKELNDNYARLIKERYDLLVKTGELEILKTKEGTDARLFEEDKAYFAQLAFMEKHKVALELNQVDIDTFKQKHYNQDIEREKTKRDIIAAADKEAHDKMVADVEELTAQKEKIDSDHISVLKQKKANIIADEKSSTQDILAVNQQLYDAELKQLEDKHAKEKALFDKALADKMAALDADLIEQKITKEQYALQVEQAQSVHNANIKNADEKLTEDRIALAKRLAEETKKTVEQEEKDILDSITKISGIVSSFANSLMGLYAAIQESQATDRENQFNALNASLEAQMASQQEYYDSALAQLEQHTQNELNQEGLTEQQKINIKNNAEIAKVALENKAAKANYDLKVLQYNAEEELKEKSFEQDKKMKTAQVVISTISGSIAAFTGMAQAIPGPYGLIAGAVAAALVVAMGAVQISNIQKQKYNKGTPPTPPKIQVPNLTPPSSNSNQPQAAPTIKDSTLYGTGGSGTGNNKPVTSSTPVNVVVNDGMPLKAYVLAGDITDVQEADEALKRKVTGF